MKLSASSAPQMIGLEADDFGLQWSALVDEVFDTEVGQFSVAPNSSNDTFYVFRVTETGPAPEELLERFNNDPLKSGPKAMARETGADIFTGWIDGIEKEMGAEWQAEGSTVAETSLPDTQGTDRWIVGARPRDFGNCGVAACRAG